MKQRELLEQSLNELRLHFESHQQLMQTALRGETLDVECSWGNCRHYQKLLNLIIETVRVLDETRRAFKSKALEQLRLQLLQTLSEETGSTLAGKQGS
jgi:hypothetical protein